INRRDFAWHLYNQSCARNAVVLTAHTQPVRSLSFSPDGQSLVSAAGLDRPDTPVAMEPPGEIKLWDAATGEECLSFRRHAGPVSAVVFSPDGKTLASSGNRTIRLWDVSTGRERTALVGHTAKVNAVCFRGDGQALASAGDDGTIRLWDATTGRETACL